MKDPLALIIERRQILYSEYQRVLNIESTLPRELTCFKNFEKDKAWDMAKIKKMLDKYDAVIDLLS